MTMALAAAFVPLRVRASWAEHAPDPRMLLDLDLFAQNSNDNSQTSMLEQIRTLRAMGYLNGPSAPNPQPMYNSPPMYNNPPPPMMPPAPPPPPGDTEDDVRE
ncbi:MAG TPA: hypothetical protein VKB84_02220 [Candidatus Binataceae bacterium]|nr:hypothetical protein [Candidatus Binataceae bacterium]